MKCWWWGRAEGQERFLLWGTIYTVLMLDYCTETLLTHSCDVFSCVSVTYLVFVHLDEFLYIN